MAKAIAITAIREQSFVPAFLSAQNFVKMIVDTMYGTQDRVNMTYSFAIALGFLGYALSLSQNAVSEYCINSMVLR